MSLNYYLASFDRYVMNEIPIHLIRLSDMKIVGRNDVKKHFRSSVSGKCFYDPAKYVKYAILSHRWLDEGEPTYEEMKAGTAAGPGYEKLESFCKKAKEYSIEFAWSDTCCIDKGSSTELDESIRSMFRWYKNSAICIVHLAQSETIEDIKKDQWMRRGWTLQELLAPHKIKFFNACWMPMTGDENDKAPSMTPDGSPDILRALEEATGIPCIVLTSNLRQCPMKVDERMAWAATRETTRFEDEAYSLMGIFDVSLQIAYGEGRDRAFCRLIEAIMQIGDPSVLNWGGFGPARHHSGSRAFPTSPVKFLGYESRQFDFDRPLEMTMTSRGLRIPLVILPLIVYSLSKSYLGSELRLGCSFCPTLEIQTTSWDSGTKLIECQYALGIVNYLIIGDGTREVLSMRGRSAGVVLSRETKSLPNYQPRSRNYIGGLDFASPPKQTLTEWKAILPTGALMVVFDFPNVPSDSHCYIDQKYLETVYI
ncbi:heterokaryon incompatibility protein-domain-containing protein [Suillus lakei]|nr:heterokaryon incompatibility protein-domain-containing protein [Suillus lakei]